MSSKGCQTEKGCRIKFKGAGSVDIAHGLVLTIPYLSLAHGNLQVVVQYRTHFHFSSKVGVDIVPASSAISKFASHSTRNPGVKSGNEDSRVVRKRCLASSDFRASAELEQPRLDISPYR